MPELLPTPLVLTVMGWVVETTLVAALLALVAALAGRARRLGPAARHALWLVVLVKLMTPPLVHWPWSRSWLPVAEAPVTAATHSPLPSPAEQTRVARPPARLERVGVDQPDPPAGLVFLPASFVPADVGFLEPPRRPEPAAEPEAAEPEPARAGRGVLAALGCAILAAWLAGSIGVAAVQVARIRRFRRRLRDTSAPPAWLVEEAERIGRRLGVRPPEIRVVAYPGTPALWCLGRPALLIPRDLLRTLEPRRWGGILAHELAHLRRGDPWVGRLALLAGLLWWWNPLYRLARRRIEAEAELACDAWVVWALPDDRLTYAESLLHVGSALSLARWPSPSLGVAGAGQTFERRLLMIVREPASCRLSALGVLAAALLLALSLPSWTAATPLRPEPDDVPDVIAAPDGVAAVIVAPAPVAETVAVILADGPDDEDDADDDDDAPRAKKARKTQRDRDADDDDDTDDDDEKAAEKFLGPDFEKRMEELGEKIGREMEAKFGPDSEFVKQIEKQFGPDSEFVKQIEKQFGPDSEFVKQMEKQFGPDSEFVKQMEKQFGPDSEFVKQMEAMGRELESKLGSKSEFAERLKQKKAEAAEQARAAKEKARAALEKARAAEEKARADRSRQREDPVRRPRAEARRSDARARRIERLEAQIEALMKELKSLKEQEEDDDGEE
jgi:beta-lactamase regulating signal transducer with metallopeptidase domain